jgi:hypothetical protein
MLNDSGVSVAAFGTRAILADRLGPVSAEVPVPKGYLGGVGRSALDDRAELALSPVKDQAYCRVVCDESLREHLGVDHAMEPSGLVNWIQRRLSRP